MYLDLTDVLRGPGQTLEKQLEIAPTTIDDIEIVEPVIGKIRVENARQNLVVRGKAKTAIAMPCARCLQPTSQPLDLVFEAVAPLRFFNLAGFGTAYTGHHRSAAPDEVDEEEPEQADDELAALFEGHTLDVLELVRQAIELQAPIQPLCSPDCPGLPEAAQYSGGGDDERWGALKSWNKNGNNGHASSEEGAAPSS
jgi:uncharacterized metal-binding protein YceD (DUF177 family)